MFSGKVRPQAVKARLVDAKGTSGTVVTLSLSSMTGQQVSQYQAVGTAPGRLES